MCGIAGLIHKGKSVNIGSELQSMLQALKHRGPDSTGYALYADNDGQNFIMRFKVGENVGEGSNAVNEEASVYDERKKIVDKNLSDIVTVVVNHSSQNGIYVQVGKENLSILIKKNQLAKEIENQRPSRFVKGDKLDAIITELDKEKREISLSIKALEEKQTREAVKKYGSKDSGGVLGEILGPLLKKKSKSKK